MRNSWAIRQGNRTIDLRREQKGKKGMKRNVVNVLTTGVIGLLALFSLAACGTNQADEETTVVKLGVVGEQNEAWEHVQEELKENENIDLQLVKFTDYRQSIVALEDGSIDLHAALTEIFMDNVNEESGYSNTTIAYTTFNPLGIYSDKITDVSELADGATVA